MTQITISDWKPLERNTLRGFCTVSLPSGLILHDAAVHSRDDSWWVSPASRPQIGRDGTVLKDDAGKVKYVPVVSFQSKAVRDRFSAGVIDALRLAHPEVFQ
jgi:hypothetical protein